jgi:aminoglycoside phosphotransferase (APT) family kinase protein
VLSQLHIADYTLEAHTSGQNNDIVTIRTVPESRELVLRFPRHTVAARELAHEVKLLEQVSQVAGTGARDHIAAQLGAFLVSLHAVPLDAFDPAVPVANDRSTWEPTLIHGDFGPSNILYDERTGALSGIIDWSSAGSGDPATDLAALIGPVSYSEDFADALLASYPTLAAELPRAQF